MLHVLAECADQLDRQGLRDEADTLTRLMERLSQTNWSYEVPTSEELGAIEDQGSRSVASLLGHYGIDHEALSPDNADKIARALASAKGRKATTAKVDAFVKIAGTPFADIGLGQPLAQADHDGSSELSHMILMLELEHGIDTDQLGPQQIQSLYRNLGGDQRASTPDDVHQLQVYMDRKNRASSEDGWEWNPESENASNPMQTNQVMTASLRKKIRI